MSAPENITEELSQSLVAQVTKKLKEDNELGSFSVSDLEEMRDQIVENLGNTFQEFIDELEGNDDDDGDNDGDEE